jgi:mRNA interferase MazF
VFAFGSIVLTRFPFTDLSGDKRRPALVVSRDNDRRFDVIVCFITSVPRMGPDMAALAALPGTGLKVPSVVRFDKITTLDRSIITGRLGDAPPDWIAAQRATFSVCSASTPGSRPQASPHPRSVRDGTDHA